MAGLSPIPAPSGGGRHCHEPPPTAGLPARAADWLPAHERLDRAMARFLGTTQALISCSGTAALVAALKALQVLDPARHKVIVPAYTCPLVPLAVVHCGLEPVLCDLLADSFDLDSQQLAELCDAHTLAVVPAHLGGRISPLGHIVDIAHQHGSWVIEDAAQALGARIDGRSVGLQGDIGFFSLAVGKGLTLFEGGVLVAQTERLLTACRAQLAQQQRPQGLWARLHGYIWDARRSAELFAYTFAYRPRWLHWAYARAVRKALAQQDLIDAAGDEFSRKLPLHRVGYLRRNAGVRALARLPDWLHKTRQQAQPRVARLKRIPGIKVIEDSSHVPGAQGSWPVIIILMPNQPTRDALLMQSWGNGLGTSLMFVHAMPDYPCYQDIIDGPQAHIVEARRLAARMLVISNSPWLDDERFDALCQAIEATTAGAAISTPPTT